MNNNEKRKKVFNLSFISYMCNMLKMQKSKSNKVSLSEGLAGGSGSQVQKLDTLLFTIRQHNAVSLVVHQFVDY